MSLHNLNVLSTENYDVIVIGAGSAGIAAAVGAARSGARTLLIERYGFAGGAATHSCVLAYCGFYAQRCLPELVVGGVGADVLQHLARMRVDITPHKVQSTGNWIITLNPEALKVALDRLLVGSGVDLMLHTMLTGMHRTGNRIDAITVSGHFGTCKLSASVFVDASGEGALSLLSDADMESQSAGDGVQPASFPIRIGGIDPDWPLDRELFRQAAIACDSEGSFHFARPNAGVVLRLPSSGDIWWMVVDFVADVANPIAFSRAEIRARHAAWRLVQCLRQVSSVFRNAYLASTGPQIGVRETRHPTARYRLTRNDASTGRTREDGVARAGWPMELHHKPGITEYIRIGGDGYFHVPLDALQARDIANLRLAGRLTGADKAAYGSIRVMGTAFATGHAAGVAAACEADTGKDADVATVRRVLLEHNAIL